MNAVSSKEYLRPCKMLEMPSKCFKNLWKKIGQRSPCALLIHQVWMGISPVYICWKRTKNEIIPWLSNIFIITIHIRRLCLLYDQLSLKSKASIMATQNDLSSSPFNFKHLVPWRWNLSNCENGSKMAAIMKMAPKLILILPVNSE